MTENIHCPNCGSDITYPQNNMQVCTQCFHEWNPAKNETEEVSKPEKVLDSNGNELFDGDTVVVINHSL
jgi:protein PhnA